MATVHRFLVTPDVVVECLFAHGHRQGLDCRATAIRDSNEGEDHRCEKKKGSKVSSIRYSHSDDVHVSLWTDKMAR